MGGERARLGLIEDSLVDQVRSWLVKADKAELSLRHPHNEVSTRQNQSNQHHHTTTQNINSINPFDSLHRPRLYHPRARCRASPSPSARRRAHHTKRVANGHNARD